MQQHTDTRFNRYPYLWEYLKDLKPKTILSYGCSTGEEAVTAQAYFPEAFVKGYDTNHIVVGIANVRFDSGFTTDLEEVKRDGPFDLILCNSVLCNHPKNWEAEKNETMSFKQFTEQVKIIDSLLVKGGTLMMMNCEYIFSDVFPCYEPIGKKRTFYVSVFNKEGNRTDNKQYAVWRKP